MFCYIFEDRTSKSTSKIEEKKKSGMGAVMEINLVDYAGLLNLIISIKLHKCSHDLCKSKTVSAFWKPSFLQLPTSHSVENFKFSHNKTISIQFFDEPVSFNFEHLSSTTSAVASWHSSEPELYELPWRQQQQCKQQDQQHRSIWCIVQWQPHDHQQHPVQLTVLRLTQLAARDGRSAVQEKVSVNWLIF